MSGRAAEMSGMSDSPQLPKDEPPREPLQPTSPLESCTAVIIGLGLRRFVVVRREGPPLMQQTARSHKRIRDLTPGDEVIYKGRREVVRFIEAYE